MIRHTIGHARNEVCTIPNLITIFGIISILLYAYCFLRGAGEPYIPVLVFAAGCSDLLDGFFARMLDQHSRLGKMLDPIRDRLLGAAVLANIVITNPSVWKIAILIGLFEVAIAVIHAHRTLAAGAHPLVHSSGKIRQAAHLVAAGVFVFQTYMPLWIAIGIPPVPIFTIVFSMCIATVYYALMMQVAE